jgi:hypothetical protein
MTTAAEFFAGREDSARLFETLRSAIEELATLAEWMMKFVRGYGRPGTRRHKKGREHPRSGRTTAMISRQVFDVKIEPKNIPA